MGGGGEEGCNMLNVECYKISGKQTMSQTKYGQKMFEKSNDNGTRIEIQIILKGRLRIRTNIDQTRQLSTVLLFSA